MAIKKVKNGWHVDVRPNGVGGKRVRKTLPSQAKAKRFESYVLGQAAIGEPYEPKKRDKRRLKDLIQLWYNYHGISLKDGNRRYSQLNALADMMGNPLATTITPADATQLRQKRLEAGITPNTVNHDQAHLRAVFNKLIKLDEWSDGNPFAKVQPLRLNEKELSYLTPEDISALFKALDESNNPDVRLITHLCLVTGARWSEAQYLRAEMLRNGRVTFTGTKNGRNRTIPLPQELYQALLAHGPRIGRLFPNPAYKAFSTAILKAGITLPTGQRTHVLRHTFASHFMMNGGDVLTLQKILGHQTISMTMRYAHLSPDHLADAIKYAPKITVDKKWTQEEFQEEKTGISDIKKGT
ncbi:phage integrase [Vreelandella gomseomensis]|uniref:Tyrosine-type recombinase/integrase n=1 Tax=Vreelandella gomseomensis TaxID=370766 RepID=A0ABU1GDD8_9GAMM|nr:tyrosine-type recombinase/integrase [Halomonas gomseomensis]MDR5875506.1 tyrosine-type recombinase/integrase [Halomonas gomseomensis]